MCPLVPLVCSLPMVADLVETCIDDAIKTPAIPTVIATEEAGPSNAYASASVIADDSLGLNGECMNKVELVLQ